MFGYITLGFGGRNLVTTLISAGAGSTVGNLTDFGGLSAAFDSVVNATAACCGLNNSNSGYDNRVGKNWGVSRTVTQLIIKSPTDAAFLGGSGGGSVGVKLRGSNDGSSWTDLWTGSTAGGNAEVKTVSAGITLTPYSYHDINFDGDTTSVRVGEVEFYEDI